MDFEAYKGLRNKRREGTEVTESEIGSVITDLKEQIAKATAEIAGLMVEGAEAGAMRRLAQMTNGDQGDAEATTPSVDFHGLQQAQRRLQKTLYWQKKATLGLGSDKTLPGYHDPYAYTPSYNEDEDEDYHDESFDGYDNELSAEQQAEAKAEQNAITNKLAEEQAKTGFSEVCGNCGFRSDINPCKICGNQIS